MNDETHAAFVQAACDAMHAARARVAELLAADTSEVDAARGLIRFSRDGEPLADAEVTCIGSWSPRSGSWMWAWANTSLPPALVAGAERLQGLGALTGRSAYTQRDAFVVPEAEALAMAAVAWQHLGGLALHVRSMDPLRCYFSVRAVTPRRSPPAMEAAAEAAVRASLAQGEGARRLNLLRQRYPALRPVLIDADLRGPATPWAHDLHAQPAFDHGLLAERPPHALARADFSRLRMDGAILRGADLRGASFEGASLVGADLSGCDLRGASLRGTFLNGTNFTRARLQDADFAGAELSRTLLTDVDLSQAQGLDQVHHMAPSEVSFSTLVDSRFEVAPAFLLAAGVSRGLIQDLANGQRFAATYQTCFLSYSSRDAAFAGRLYRALTDAGVRVFWDRLDIVPGDYLETQIVQAIRESKRLLVVLSAASMASDWVEREVRTAMHHDPHALLAVRLCPIEDVNAWTHARALPPLGSQFPIHDFSGHAEAAEFERGVQAVLKALASGALPR